MPKKSTVEITPLVRAIHGELRVRIVRLGLTQYRLQELTGISQGVISKSIYRDESTLNLSQLEKIVRALQTDMGTITTNAQTQVREQEQKLDELRRDPVLQQLIDERLQQAQNGYALAAKRGDPLTGGTWG